MISNLKGIDLALFDLVKALKKDALFWHAVWKSAGSPLNNCLHNIMRSTRYTYHRAVKKCKRAELDIKKSKLLDTCVNGNGDLF